jgi:hypothetical protein
MRYLVTALVKPGQEAKLLQAIDAGTLGAGSVAGDEYVHNMQHARVSRAGTVQWVETCFCPTPLLEERPYWEQYFDLVKVQDAHRRKNCRDENGSEPWACCGCDCTKKLEDKLAQQGADWLATLRKRGE